jgi:hypothetical protein
MPQDRKSGARASQYGRDCGKRIIEAIGGKSVKAGSNEFSLGEETLSVHCARRNTDRVGVTYKALDGVSAVLGAFEQEDGSYVVWRMPKEKYQQLMTNTRSLGPSQNRVGMVKRVDFERYGTRFAIIPAFSV